MKIKSLFCQFLVGILAFVPILASCDSDDVTLAKVDDAQQIVDLHSITPAVAIDVAARFTDRNNGDVAKAVSRSTLPIETIRDNNDNVIAYAVNYEDGGWVVVSATKAYYPILAYSDEGQFAFEKSDQTTGLEIWIDEIGQAIESADSFDDETTSQIALEWLEYQTESLSTSIGSGLPGGNSPEAVVCRARLKELNETYYQDGWSFTTLPQVSEVTMPSDVYSLADSHSSPYEYTIVGLCKVGEQYKKGPLMTTKWHQDFPYNYQCPGKVGCVPTAMAQIMKYHRYPANYNWNDMPDDNATATLQNMLHDVGVEIGVDYGYDMTTVATTAAVEGFHLYGYDAVLKSHKDSEVIDFVLSNDAPVFMGGFNPSSSYVGHAWVCDGVQHESSQYGYYVEYLVDGTYDNLNLSQMDDPLTIEVSPKPCRFHMNWGEKDLTNGWYLTAKIDDKHDYTYSRSNIYALPKQ